MACAKVQVCCLSIESEIPPSSSNFNQSKLFYKLKHEIDSANRQINLQSNLIGLMERRVQHKTGCGGNDDDKEFERNYRYWRRKLLKLKRDRKVANVNLYDLLFDLYRYLQTVETDKLTLNREREEEESRVQNSENTEEEVVKPKRKYVTKRMLLQQQQQAENNKQRLDDKEQQQLFECHFCTKKAKSKRSLVAHMVQAHKEEQIHFCDIDGCQERFSSPSLLRNHKLEQHTNVIECKKCHKFFNNRTILNKHRLSMHKLVCSVEGCAKICTTKRQMQQHLASHSIGGGLPACSTEANKRTRRAVTAGSNLDKKKYQVKPKKTFQCPKCSRTFTKAFDFKTHLKAVDCTKVWCCHVENCPEMFYKLKFLTEHCLTVHNEPVRFRCTWPGCNKMCNENRRLKSHYRVHTGERPYQCNWPGCDKRFKTSSCLCGHLKQHKNELKYSCPYPDCDYKANTNCTMRSHIRIRHEKKYYKRNRKKPLVNVNVVETNNSNGRDDTADQNQLNSTINLGQTQRKTNLTGTNQSNTSLHLTKLKL